MASDRIIEGRPLSTIWGDDGNDLPNQRIEDIGRETADRLVMSDNPPVLVIAQVGAPMRWVRSNREDLRRFWRGTPRSAYYQTAESHDDVYDRTLGPGMMFYASRWEDHDSCPVLLLEMVFWPSKVNVPS